MIFERQKVDERQPLRLVLIMTNSKVQRMNGLLPPAKVEEIKAKANAVLAKYPHISDPRQLMLQIAADHDIKLIENELFEMSGALRKENEKWVIYINKSDSPQRKLFTLAHELGHFFVHSEMRDEFVDGQLISRTEQEKYAAVELEANEFAGNLIMPEEKIRRELPQENVLTEKRVIDLAKEFNVSAIAMATRLRNLNYDVPGYTSKAA